jgi:hypothetical protein
MKYLSLLFITLIIILMATPVVFGQLPGLPGDEPPPQTPIDGGLGLLAAAGGAYAYKKLRGSSES